MRKLLHNLSFPTVRIRHVQLSLLILAFFPAPANAQFRLSAADSCSSLNLHSSPNSLLRRYFTQTNGVGGRGCWVHIHPNGRDYVITPNSWGRIPNPGKRGLVLDAFDALTRTPSAVERRYPGTLNNDLPKRVVLNEVTNTSLPHGVTRFDDACWFQVGLTGHVGSPRDVHETGRGRSYFKQMVAHEIGHCLIGSNSNLIGGWGGLTNSYDNVRWAEEGGAELISTIAYPSVNAEWEDSIYIDLFYKNFKQPYRSFLLIEHLARTRGSLFEVLDILKRGHTYSSLMNLFKRHGWDAFHHWYAVDHYLERIPDPGGCDGRPCNYASTPPSRFHTERTLDASQERGSVDLSSLGEARLNLIRITIPSDKTLQLITKTSTPEKLHGSITSGPTLSRFWVHSSAADNITIPGTCDANTEVELALSHYHTGPVSTSIPYRLEDIDDCEEEGPTACIVGDWLADPAWLSSKDVVGDIRLSFSAEGVFSARWAVQYNNSTRKRPVDVGRATGYFKEMQIANTDFLPTHGIRVDSLSGFLLNSLRWQRESGTSSIELLYQVPEMVFALPGYHYSCSDSSLAFPLLNARFMRAPREIHSPVLDYNR